MTNSYDRNPDIHSLLQPFLTQSAPIRSIVAVGCDDVLGVMGNELRLDPAHPSAPVIALEPIQPGGDEREGYEVLDDLARRAHALSAPASGDDLLVLHAESLDEWMTPIDADFSFRAVVALLPKNPSDENGWKLRRSLFDRGLICIGAIQLAGSTALCFLVSDAIRSVSNLDIEPRGYIAVSKIKDGGRFANQMFRYAFVRLYALRHGLTAAVPEWEGQQIFGLDDQPCAGLDFPKLQFAGFSDQDLRLWDKDDPPIDIDVDGYFQEIPKCWRRHRPLLRSLFQLTAGQSEAIDGWQTTVTEGGRRTLVAIHIRRGDYRILQSKTTPWFRFVPEEWYLELLRNIWPTLREPTLFVATDEPDTILPQFCEFEMVSKTPESFGVALPDHIRDFEILKRADYLALCNSSFSRMAAILAPSTQKCFLPSFETQSFMPYEPWTDPAFWARFSKSWQGSRLNTKPRGQATNILSRRNSPDPSTEPTIFVDVSDLLFYLLHHTTLSGIQRVQCEILRNLLDIPQPQPIRFIVLNKRGELRLIETFALMDIVESIRSDAASRPGNLSEIGELVTRAVPCELRSRDIFLTIGAFWTVAGTGTVLQQLKNSGVIIGVFIHDIISISDPEYFETRATRVFVKGVIEALTFADFILTTSEYNRKSLTEHLASKELEPLPIHLVPLGDELTLSLPAEPKVSNAVAGILETDFVLCVGTIEVRKNPVYLFNLWKLMVQSGRANVPHLIFAGRQGWLVQDFIDQLKACNYLDGRIVVAHNITDVELALLYRKCLLTVFPSFVEGWGLPVGESLAHGKICLCSAAGGVPEVGGEFVEYVDPYNVRDGLEKLLRYVDNPELLRERELEITNNFKPRLWRKTAEDLLQSTQILARQVAPSGGVKAILLPPNRLLPVRSDAPVLPMNAIDGALSAELICISGWDTPEVSGVRAAEEEAVIRFRADAPVGTRINLALRLSAHGRDFHIQLRSGSGSESKVTVAQGTEKMAVVPCEVEPGNLVTAQFSVVDSNQELDESSETAYWMLNALLYFDPKRVAGEVLKKMKGARPGASTAPAPAPEAKPDRAGQEANGERILLRPIGMDENRRAASFGSFLESSDSYWPLSFSTDRDAPIFADQADRRVFYSGCGNTAHAPQVGRINDSIKLIRRSNLFVSMSRFSEGSAFDRAGVWKSCGYLQNSPPGLTPWFSIAEDGIWMHEGALARAPYYDHSCLVFYNGNLHNYFHWLVEGLLILDILTRSLGPHSKLKIVLPKSMDINALLDHRESLRAVGLGTYETIEISENLIKVKEAIWAENDTVQTMPAPYLKDFQRRLAIQYAGLRGPRNRRLLVARKGPTRMIHNLDQVQMFLSRYDFETVYLEGMSTVDQILLFQSAEFIIAPHGAGLANLLFCEPGTKVIELMPSVELRPFFWLISEKLGLVYGLQFCEPVPGEGFQGSITVDTVKLQALIRMVDAHF